MGWWKIKDIKSGQIDWDQPKKPKDKLINAISGKDDKDVLYNGDGVADAMDAALRQINVYFKRAWNRPVTYDELLACFNFCANGIRDGKKKLS